MDGMPTYATLYGAIESARDYLENDALTGLSRLLEHGERDGGESAWENAVCALNTLRAALGQEASHWKPEALPSGPIDIIWRERTDTLARPATRIMASTRGEDSTLTGWGCGPTLWEAIFDTLQDAIFEARAARETAL